MVHIALKHTVCLMGFSLRIKKVSKEKWILITVNYFSIENIFKFVNVDGAIRNILPLFRQPVSCVF